MNLRSPKKQRIQDYLVDVESICHYNSTMQGQKYIFWQDNNMWLGYLEEYPDYMTQGVTVDELEKNLRDIYLDISSGEIPGVRRVAELQL